MALSSPITTGVMGRASLTPGYRLEHQHSQPSLLQELLNKMVLLFKQKLTFSEHVFMSHSSQHHEWICPQS